MDAPGSRCQNLRNKSSLQNESSFDTDQDGDDNFPAAHDTTRDAESVTLRPGRETVSNNEVNGEVVFCVGSDGVFLHNTYPGSDLSCEVVVPYKDRLIPRHGWPVCESATPVGCVQRSSTHHGFRRIRSGVLRSAAHTLHKSKYRGGIDCHTPGWNLGYDLTIWIRCTQPHQLSSIDETDVCWLLVFGS